MRKNVTPCNKIAELLNISNSRGMEATIKAQLIAGICSAVEKGGLTHQELSKRSGLPCSAVTGILTGSLQKITIDRILKLVEAVGLIAEVKLRRAA
jgi:predicted XRE-type DNA-binding protein